MISGHHMRQDSRTILPHCCLFRSWNWAANSSRNCVHTIGKLSLTWSSPSIQVPMSCTHPVTSSSLIRVRVKATFLIGELNPAMSSLTQKYALTSSMKLSALVLSLVNLWGRFPIALMSAAAGTAAWPWPVGAGWPGGGPPPLPLLPPLPPPPPPPPG